MWAQGDLETSGRPSTVDELITLAGAVNVCASIEQEHLVVNMEKVLKWDPQVIVMWYNARKDPADILHNPMWQSISAVRQQRVYEFPDIFSCDLWTLKYQYAVKMVAKWCYPELFRDLDLKERSWSSSGNCMARGLLSSSFCLRACPNSPSERHPRMCLAGVQAFKNMDSR